MKYKHNKDSIKKITSLFYFTFHQTPHTNLAKIKIKIEFCVYKYIVRSQIYHVDRVGLDDLVCTFAAFTVQLRW